MALTFDNETTGSLERVYFTRDAIRRRAAVLEAARIQEGERILDIGTGPGFLACEMADAAGPQGHVVGIDASGSMLELAAVRCAYCANITLREGEATRLPVEDAGFDVAISIQVYEYIPDVEGALREMYRALRSGGRAVVGSTDWRAIAWNAGDPERMSRVLAAFEDHCSYNDLPRWLAPAMRKIGFVIEQQQVIPQFNPVYDPDTYSFGMARLIRAFVAGRKGVTEEDALAWLEDLERAGERGEYFFNLNQYLCTARKP